MKETDGVGEMEYCADAIALYNGKLVIVERLKEPKGYALPGGRRDLIDSKLEEISSCAIREFREETGLHLRIEGTLGTYDQPNRDPRGPKISDVVYGQAYGKIRNEQGKTKVILLNLEDIHLNKSKFVFDHYQMLEDWLRLNREK